MLMSRLGAVRVMSWTRKFSRSDTFFRVGKVMLMSLQVLLRGGVEVSLLDVLGPECHQSGAVCV